MDREEFKLRMKSLKSYRELNPGKGYWDWRNSLPDNLRNTDDSEYDMRGAYESGAQPVYNEYDQSYHLPTRDPRTGKYLKKSWHPSYWEGLAADIKEGYYPYTVGNDTYTRNPNTEQVFGNYKVEAFQDGGITGDYEPGEASLQYILARHWLENWFRNRPKQMAKNIDDYVNLDYYASSLTKSKVSPWFWLNKERNAKRVAELIIDLVRDTPVFDYREPWIANDKNVLNRREFLKLPASTQGAYFKNYPEKNAISISPVAEKSSTLVHELTHASLNGYNILTSKVDEILKKHQKENGKKDIYWDKPEEVYAREMEFRYLNNILPEDVITKEQIEKWKKDGGVVDPSFINRYSTNTLEDLLNGVAQAYSTGGITGDPVKGSYKEELFRRQEESNKRLYTAEHPTQQQLQKVRLREAEINRELTLFQNVMNNSAKSVLAQDKVELHLKQKEEEVKDRLYPYKLLGNSLATAGELTSAYYILGKGAKALGLLPKSRLVDGLYASDVPQIWANGIGATADGYLLLTANSSPERIENSIELPMDVAGIIGGTNWFRRIPGIPTKIDDILDWMGYSAAAYDGIIKPSVKGLFNITKPIEENK